MRPFILLVLLGTRLTVGQQQQILEDQLSHSGLYSDLHEYNYVPNANAQESHSCPFGHYFNGEKCVPNQQGHPCIPGWTYNPLAGECQPQGTSPRPPPSNCEDERQKCEKDLTQCRNDYRDIFQKLTTCERERDACTRQPPLPTKPGKYVPDPSGKKFCSYSRFTFLSNTATGIYKCSFIPDSPHDPTKQPCTGRLRTGRQQGTVFKQFFYRNDGYTFPNPWVTTIHGPAVLEVVDQWCRVAQYEVKVDGQSVGKTSDVQFENNCNMVWCGPNRDECVNKGFSHGWFLIPPGMSHRVEVYWVNGRLTNAWGGRWTHNQGLYRVWDACP